MYRKHLKEMENKTGIKTIDHISEIPVVNSALNNVTDYYSKVKERSSLLRTSCNLAEMSIKTMAFAATPIASLCKKPIDSVDTFLYDKLHELEHNYPTIVKPTDQLTSALNSQAKLLYSKTVQEPIDLLTNIKERTITYGSNTVQAVFNAGVDTVDAALENKFAKMLTNPLLDLTERSLDYWLPNEQLLRYDAVNPETSSEADSEQHKEHRTLRRIYDINNRVYKHVYQTTFTQLSKIHFQFENTLTKLQQLKQLTDSFYSSSRERVATTLQSVSNNTLLAQCLSVVNRDNLSLERLDQLSRQYSKAILTDVTQMVEKYLALVKSFPVVFNATRLRQTVDNLMSQLNKDSFSTYLTSALDQLKTIHQALLSYTNQMFQVVNDSRITQFLLNNANNKPTANNSVNESSATTANGTTSTGANKKQHWRRKHSK